MKAENETQKIGYYSIIPATILYNKELKANEKILYAIITSLANKEGYCYASNRYIAEKLGVGTNTVSGWITDLRRRGFIQLEILRKQNKEIIQRRIYINDITYTINKEYHYNTNEEEGILKKSKDNNIINNNINNNILSNRETDKVFFIGQKTGKYKPNCEQRQYTKEFLESLYAN